MLKAETLTELVKNHNYPPITGKTSPNGSDITDVTLSFALPSSSGAESLSPTPPPPSSVQMNGQSDYCCVPVGGTDTRGPVFLPFPWQNNASFVGPFVNHCNICILNSKSALS